jgi:phosphate transport system permease protein
VSAVPSTHPLPERRRVGDRFGDLFLHGLTGAAAAAALDLARRDHLEGLRARAGPAITKYGFAFVTRQGWDTIHNKFGALDLIWGTALTSFSALLIATPLSIAIGLYLSELAPRGAVP